MELINRLSTALIIIMSSLILLVPALARADCTACGSTQKAIQCGVNSAASGDCNAQPSGNIDTTIKNIINILSILVGVVAVIMIIIGGFKYITSAGNAESAKSAKNTIVYALIGIIIVVLAQTIARFVLTTTTNASSPPSSSSSSNSNGTQCANGQPIC